MPSLAADDEFFACASGLIAAGIDTSQSTAACGATRYPGELVACVTNVNQETGIAAEDALVGCERSRRPEEVASCTIQIHEDLLAEPSVMALDYCSRSLLPERYGTCVVELDQAAELGLEESLGRCIRAGYRPWAITPRL